MLTVLGGLLGGVGLFLLGMILLTDALKALAGEALRRWLQRFTGSRLRAAATGAGVTALVQSSSATTLATIGFVSAGLLSFQSAIGVVIGANIGTTSTGWIVSLLGLKLSVAALALPLVGVGALMKLLGRDRLALTGMALAGFGILFVGIEVLQGAMAGLSARVDLAAFAADGLAGRLLLVLVGLGMAVLLQSSSAAVATTLTALAAGAVDLQQAAALVIGQNIGTTVTAAIAAMGGNTNARRTALVHVVFNLGTGLIAFLALPLLALLGPDLGVTYAGADDALAIAAFHTAFNLVGAAVFLPLSGQLGRLAVRLVPERQAPLLRHIDTSLHAVPALAIGAADTALRRAVGDAFHALSRRLRDDVLPVAPVTARFGEVVDELGPILARMPAPQAQADQQRLLHLLHAIDHARALRDDLQASGQADGLSGQAALRVLAGDLAESLERIGASLAVGAPVDAAQLLDLQECTRRINDVHRNARPAIVEEAAGYRISVASALSQLGAQRWLERVAAHAGRCVTHLQGVAGSPLPAPAAAPA